MRTEHTWPRCEALISPFEYLPRLGRGAVGLHELTRAELAAPMPQCERPGELRAIVGKDKPSHRLCAHHAWVEATAYDRSVSVRLIDERLWDDSNGIGGIVEVHIFDSARDRGEGFSGEHVLEKALGTS